jgi:aspartyl-tRNA(Asn)/glutamyl-tRNA(Gln) amidotransferase subunit A
MSIDFQTHIIPDSIVDFHMSLAERKCTVTDVVKEYLGIIKLKNKDINAYLEVYEDSALAAALSADKQLEGKTTAEIELHIRKHRLFGVPFALKDNILMQGKRAGAASRVLDTYISSYDATVVTKLNEAGAICLGRVNMDEFAMGSSTENSAYGVTRNPLHLEYVPGGTSGGSAAAVAMIGCLFAIGSDTGGSIRQPASYCGVVGLKPTYGSVSRHGLMPMASSFDVIGPIAKNIEDVELVFDVIKGVDRFDSTSHETKNFTVVDTLPRPGLRVGVPREFIFTDGITSEVKQSIEQTIVELKSKGVEIVDLSIPLLNTTLAAYYILVPAEVSSNMARFDGVRYGEKVEGKDLLEDYMQTRGHLLGREVKKRIILGTYILSAGYHDAYYRKAGILREALTKDIKEAFTKVDAILMPTTPDTAFKIGEKSEDSLALYLGDIFTVTANLAGIPAISIPHTAGEDETGRAVYGTSSGLPLGIQLMANTDREDVLFALGKMIY